MLLNSNYFMRFTHLMQIIITLPVLYLITYDILMSIMIMQKDAKECMYKTAITAITFVFCIEKIAMTWLKTLCVLNENDVKNDNRVSIFNIQDSRACKAGDEKDKMEKTGETGETGETEEKNETKENDEIKPEI